MIELPFSLACERNQGPILDCLKIEIPGEGSLLEIGHGSGQHAVFFARSLPEIRWVPSDRAVNQWMMQERIKHEGPLSNLAEPIVLEVGRFPLNEQAGEIFDYVFTANTFHIMSPELVRQFCRECGDVIRTDGKILIYGPFKFDGKFTSQSNAEFDVKLKQQDEHMGIREFSDIADWMSKSKLSYEKKYDLPANNHLLVFSKS